MQPSPGDPNVNVRQDTYLRALQAHCPLVELYYGHFLRHRIPMEHAIRRWRASKCGRTRKKARM